MCDEREHLMDVCVGKRTPRSPASNSIQGEHKPQDASRGCNTYYSRIIAQR